MNTAAEIVLGPKHTVSLMQTQDAMAATTVGVYPRLCRAPPVNAIRPKPNPEPILLEHTLRQMPVPMPDAHLVKNVKTVRLTLQPKETPPRDMLRHTLVRMPGLHLIKHLKPMVGAIPKPDAPHQVPQNLPTNAQAQVIQANVSRGRQWSNFLSAAQPVPQSTIPSAPQPYALRSTNHVLDSHITLQHNSGQRADILNQTGLSSVPVRPAPSQPRLSERARGKQPEQPRAHRHRRPLPPIPTTQNWNARAAQDGYHGHHWQPAQAQGPSQSLAVQDTASTFQLTILSSRRGSSVATSDSSSEAVFKSPNSMSRFGGSPPASPPSSLAWTVPFRWTFLTGVRIEYPIFTKVALLILFECPNICNFTSMIGDDYSGQGWTHGRITHETLKTLSIKASDEPNLLFDNLNLPNLQVFRLSWDAQQPHLLPWGLRFRRMIGRSRCPLSTLSLVNICPTEEDLVLCIGYVKHTLKRLVVRAPRDLVSMCDRSRHITGQTLQALRWCRVLESLELTRCDTKDGELANFVSPFQVSDQASRFQLLYSFWRGSSEHPIDNQMLEALRKAGDLLSRETNSMGIDGQSGASSKPLKTARDAFEFIVIIFGIVLS
ncbi:hypothetical protein Hypma_016502 [Hypsizygus marmoreus]|uniref:Uncharacterized protein n=1 Tax=Hypsizygus marmoreus TaxID=39966 RepID=A0A369J5Z0_HYPMA|nr:hypothetical protein Hypma_016502 [Hypsizygus marmoreus]